MRNRNVIRTKDSDMRSDEICDVAEDVYVGWLSSSFMLGDDNNSTIYRNDLTVGRMLYLIRMKGYATEL